MLVPFVRFALEQEPAGQVPEYVDKWILHGADDAAGVFGLIRGKARVKAGDDDIEFREQIVVEIQFVLKNVHLGAGEEAEINAFIGKAPVDFFYLPDLLADAGGLEAVGLKGGFGMIGDGPVIAAEFDHVGGNLLERVAAVAPVGMVVEGAAQIGPLDEARDSALFRGGEFALVLAQFRRDIREVEVFKELLLGPSPDKPVL